MKRKYLMGGLSALTLGAVVMASVVPAAARGMDGKGFGPRPLAFEQLDTDGNGALSLEEFRAPMEARLKAIDTDGDGKVSQEELEAARKAGPRGEGGRGDGKGERMMGKKDGHHGKWGHGDRAERGFGGPRGFATEEQRQERAKAMIEMKDTNGDGVLSVDELAAAPDGSRIFAKIDADGDGSISKEEYDAARAKFAEGRGKMFRKQN